MTAQPDIPDPVTPLAAELAAQGLTARALARAAGVHENSVYGWAAGKATPTTAKAGRVAAALGVPVERLFPAVAEQQRRAQVAAVVAPGRRPRVRVSEQDRHAVTLRLADAMARQQLTARALADRLGVSSATVHRWLAGFHLPHPDIAAKAADTLGLPVAQLLPPPEPATRLEAAAAQRGWDTRQLAAAAGVSPESAKSWLAGIRTPLAGNAAKLAAALDRPVAELFDLAPAQHPDQPQPQPQAPRTLTPHQVLDVPATGQKDWQADAACAALDGDPEQWWPPGDDPAFEARVTCAGCPVLGDCRDAYLASPDTPEGRTAIWAGLPGGRLRAIARARHSASARDPRVLDAAQGREQTGRDTTSSAVPLRRDQGATTQPAGAVRQRDLAASARAHRDVRASIAPDGADLAPGRALTADTGISP